MTGPEFATLFGTALDLRKRINLRAMKKARGYTPDAEDMVQEAWIRIMREPSGLAQEVYFTAACKGIYAAHMRLYRQRGGSLTLQNQQVTREAVEQYLESENVCSSVSGL